MKNNAYLLKLLAVALIIMTGTTGFAQVDLSGKHISRTNSNLLTYEDSKLPRPSNTAKWKHIFKGQAAWKKKDIDKHVLWSNQYSYDTGTGSFKLSTPGSKDKVIMDNLVLEGGKTYTISMRCLAPFAAPSPVLLVQVSRKHKGKYINDFNQMFGPGEANKWEAFTFFFDLAPDDDSIRIQIMNYQQPTKGRVGMTTAYVDDIYLGKGKGFAEPPSAKMPFTGTNTRIDELGNIEVKENGLWKPFFPFIIYPDGRRDLLKNESTPLDDGWKLYAHQGFNAVVTGADNTTVKSAIKSGLRPLFSLGFYYGKAKSKQYQNFAHLEKRLTELKNKGLYDQILFYYIDNEVHGTWKPMKAVTDYVINWEKANYGKSRTPIYMLNGTTGLAPKYKNAHSRVADFTGTYIRSKQFATDRFIALDNPANQKMPVVIAQLNGNKMPLRTRLYGAIAHGARGMGYWRDFAPTNKPGKKVYLASRDITKTPWWKDFPDIVQEVKDMMPLIRQPHWTTWKVSCNNEYVDIGTRVYENKGYLIVANYNQEAVEVTFEVDGLPFSSCPVEDYFSPHKQVAYMTNSSFTISIPAHGVGVYCLNKKIKK